MSPPKTLDDIERHIETACETRTLHVTELATLMLDLIGAVRHDLANQHAMTEHVDFQIKKLAGKLGQD